MKNSRGSQVDVGVGRSGALDEVLSFERGIVPCLPGFIVRILLLGVFGLLFLGGIVLALRLIFVD